MFQCYDLRAWIKNLFEKHSDTTGVLLLCQQMRNVPSTKKRESVPYRNKGSEAKTISEHA